MRISDWSSDVCSSDLLIPLGALKEHRHPVVSRHDRRIRTHRPAGLDRRLVREVPAETRPRHDRLILHRKPGPGLRAGGPGGVSEMGRRDEPRWDAHTSELKSPLRSLYAVFCWNYKRLNLV